MRIYVNGKTLDPDEMGKWYTRALDRINQGRPLIGATSDKVIDRAKVEAALLENYQDIQLLCTAIIRQEFSRPVLTRTEVGPSSQPKKLEALEMDSLELQEKYKKLKLKLDGLKKELASLEQNSHYNNDDSRCYESAPPWLNCGLNKQCFDESEWHDIQHTIHNAPPLKAYDSGRKWGRYYGYAS